MADALLWYFFCKIDDIVVLENFTTTITQYLQEKYHNNVRAGPRWMVASGLAAMHRRAGRNTRHAKGPELHRARGLPYLNLRNKRITCQGNP